MEEQKMGTLNNKKGNGKIIIAVVLVVVALLVCYIGIFNKDNKGDSNKVSTTKSNDKDSVDYENCVKEWHNQIIDAYLSGNTSELDKLTGIEDVTTISNMYTQANIQRGDKCTINILDVKGDTIVFTLIHDNSGTWWKGGLVKENGQYVFWNSTINDMSQYTCSKCSGTGTYSVSSSAPIACGICGGTGQQYIDMLYHDGVMWQGGYVACSGCAGSGQISNGNIEYHTCTWCGGTGVSN